MTETLSDIFSENEPQFSSDTEVSDHDSETVQKLKDQVEALQKENRSLMAQFEGTITLANQIESMNAELLKVKNQNRQLSSENEDLSHRLELSIRAKEEIIQKMAEESKNNSKARSENYINSRQEAEKQKAFYQQQLDEANERIEELENQIESNNVSNKLIEGKIDRLVQNAQRFFDIEFNSFDDLSNYLSKPNQNNDLQIQQQTQPQTRQIPLSQQQQPQYQQYDRAAQQENAKLSEVISKLRSTKAKAKQLAQTNEELENTIEDLVRKNNELTNTQKSATNEIQSQLNAEKEANKHKTQEISDLQAQIGSLKVAIDQAEKAKKVAEDQLAVKPQVVTQKVIDTKKIEELKASYEEEKQKLMLENATISQKFNREVNKTADLSAKLKSTTNELNEAKQLIEKQKNEIQAISCVRDNALNDAESLRKALHSKQPKVEQKPQQKPLISKADLAKLKNENETQKQELIQLHIQENKNLATIDDQRRQINDLKQQLASAEEETKQKALDLNEAIGKLNKKPEITPESVLPAEVWRTNDFGSSVGAQINAIASNSSLQPISKLHAIYNAIKSAHEDEINELDDTNTALAKEFQKLQSQFNQFLVDTSVALTDEAYTLDDFNNSHGDSLISSITVMRGNYDNMKHIYDSIQATLGDILGYLNLPENATSGEIIDTIAAFTNELEETSRLLDEEKKKFKLLKQSYKEASQKSQEREAEILREKEEFEQENGELSQANEKMTKELRQTKKENEEISKELNEVKGKLDQLNSTLDKELAVRLQTLKAESEKEANHLRAELEAANETIKVQEKTLDDNEALIKDLHKKVTDLTNEKSQLVIEISTTKMNNEDAIKSIEEKMESEKQSIKQQFDTAVNQLREQCKNQSEDLTKLAEKNSSLVSKMAQVKAAYVKMQSEKRKAENEAKFALEQSERDKRLIEAQCRAKVVSAENNYNARLEEIKSQKDAEMRRIFTYTADQFKNFFNPSSQFTERTFRALVEQVKEELTTLSVSDDHIRKMLGVGEKQSTEDAVALLLIH